MDFLNKRSTPWFQVCSFFVTFLSYLFLIIDKNNVRTAFVFIVPFFLELIEIIFDNGNGYLTYEKSKVISYVYAIIMFITFLFLIFNVSLIIVRDYLTIDKKLIGLLEKLMLMWYMVYPLRYAVEFIIYTFTRLTIKERR